MLEAQGEYRWTVHVVDDAQQPWDVEIVLDSSALFKVAEAAIQNVTKRSTRGGFKAHARIALRQSNTLKPTTVHPKIEPSPLVDERRGDKL